MPTARHSLVIATKNKIEEPIPSPGNQQCYGLVLMLPKQERMHCWMVITKLLTRGTSLRCFSHQNALAFRAGFQATGNYRNTRLLNGFTGA